MNARGFRPLYTHLYFQVLVRGRLDSGADDRPARSITNLTGNGMGTPLLMASGTIGVWKRPPSKM